MPTLWAIGQKPVRRILDYFTQYAWRLSVFAVLASGLITASISLLFLSSDGLITGLTISTVCSGPLSYIVARYILGMQRRLKVQNRELIAMNQELNAFAHTVAHDLKNPLGNMAGYADLLYDDFEEMSPADVKDRLERIRRAAQQASRIIDELLLLAEVRERDIQTGVVDMQTTVKKARARLENMLEACDAELYIPDEMPPALGYAPWVEEMWTNYISNSIKYGGQPPRIDIGATPDATGYVRFWVRDNGPGISTADQAQLFREFTRLAATSQQEGTGLGLSIVQRIARRLGGQVGVESQPGQGSLFYFTLPAPQVGPARQETSVVNGES